MDRFAAEFTLARASVPYRKPSVLRQRVLRQNLRARFGKGGKNFQSWILKQRFKRTTKRSNYGLINLFSFRPGNFYTESLNNSKIIPQTFPQIFHLQRRSGITKPLASDQPPPTNTVKSRFQSEAQVRLTPTQCLSRVRCRFQIR